MTLRAARRDDHARILAVQPEWWGDRDLTALIQPLFLENFAGTSLVLEEDDELVAFLLGFPSVDDPDEAYVHFVGVAPSRRGAGVGRALHDAFADRMRERGVRRIRCVTSPINTASVAFHEAIGFRVDDGDEQYVHLTRELAPGGRFMPRQDSRPDDPPWPTVTWPVAAGTVLTGSHVNLALAQPDDAEELFTALDDDAVWAHVRGRPADAAELGRALADAESGGRWPWIVRQDGRIVGTTSYLEVSPGDARLEIGFTLYARRVWGGVVNPECKLLLMDLAFEHGVGRGQLKTDNSGLLLVVGALTLLAVTAIGLLRIIGLDHRGKTLPPSSGGGSSE